MRPQPFLIIAIQAIRALASPTVQLGNGTVVGITDGVTNAFYGIPFAQAPVGPLRFQVPQSVSPYTGSINATAFGNLCFQFDNETGPEPPWVTPQEETYLATLDAIPALSTFSEDCLNLNVFTPSNATSGDKLPVVAYIFLGAFAFGGSTDIDGRVMVNRSIELGEPVVLVSMNYRLGPYGLLPGAAIKDAQAGNLGLQDQREALRWIQKYVSNFGGDPSRVILLGLSSGGVSSAMHTVVNDGNTEGLFHGVWAESGAIQPVGPIDLAPAQATYDRFAAALNCTNANETESLECLREASVEAINAVGQSLGVWSPHADGTFVTDLPQKLLTTGKSAKIPIVAGNAEDEGTALTILNPSLSNDTQLEAELRVAYYQNISDANMEKLLRLYPNDPAKGAPYGTGDDYVLTPMYKRFASIAGDAGIDAVRRLFTRTFAQEGRDVWAYRYARNRQEILAFGATHGSEIPNIYGGGDMGDFLIHFANTLNPNGGPAQKQHWPQYYSGKKPTLLEFTGNGTIEYALIHDTYREEEIEFLIELNLNNTWPY